MRRGSIKRTSTGWEIQPEIWSEPKASTSPQARLCAGRIVRVTFDFIVDDEATRDAIDEQVFERLNGEFDLFGKPELKDLGIRTDRAELLQQVLSAASEGGKP